MRWQQRSCILPRYLRHCRRDRIWKWYIPRRDWASASWPDLYLPRHPAYAFLDYINDPENAAKCYEYIGYYCTNKAAEEYISDDMKKMIVLPEDAAEGEIVQNISQEAEDLHAEIWNQFKNACN